MADVTIQRNSRAVFRRLEAGAGAVLLHLDTGEYRQLNETGALIWSLLEDAPNRTALIAAVRDAVTNPPANLDAEVDAFVAALAERGLVDTRSEPEG